MKTLTRNMPSDVRELLEHLFKLAPTLDGEGLDHFDGYFVHWDEVTRALYKAWPDKHVGYSESPLELVHRLIDERDALLMAVRVVSAGIWRDKERNAKGLAGGSVAVDAIEHALAECGVGK
jgi:hypothetical protein